MQQHDVKCCRLTIVILGRKGVRRRSRKRMNTHTSCDACAQWQGQENHLVHDSAAA